MKKLLAALVASLFAFGAVGAHAASTPASSGTHMKVKTKAQAHKKALKKHKKAAHAKAGAMTK